MKAVPNTIPGWPGAIASADMPFSRHHACLNSGPYQRPPSMKAETAAASTANQLMPSTLIASPIRWMTPSSAYAGDGEAPRTWVRSACVVWIRARQAGVGVQVAVAQFGLARTHRDRAAVQPDLPGDVRHVEWIAAPQHQVGALADRDRTADVGAHAERVRRHRGQACQPRLPWQSVGDRVAGQLAHLAR